MEPDEIQHQLAYFTGTEHYYKMYPNLVLTDGTKFLAETCGAYWLIDMIWSYLSHIKDTFAIARLEVKPDREALFTLADDNPPQHIYASQWVGWTDLSLGEITLYLVREGKLWIVLLPSEY